jgi:hypothetical protein
MKFNLNDNCKVRLTDHGREILQRDHYDFWMKCNHPEFANNYHPPIEDVNGWSTWQMWILMQKLGQYQGIGVKNVFDLDIEIVETNK